MVCVALADARFHLAGFGAERGVYGSGRSVFSVRSVVLKEREVGGGTCKGL